MERKRGENDMDTMHARLEKLVPAIAARREEIEKARRMPRDLVDALRETGIFALELPRVLGGKESAPLDALRAIETIARADGSTGWCAMTAVVSNGASGFMNEAGAREIFADPTAPTAGISAPIGEAVRVDGGVKVSGRWAFASGVTHCEWMWFGCRVMENGQPKMTPMGPEMLHAWVPISSIEIHDTWNVSGLCGTGSHDVSAKDVFVPEPATFVLADPRRRRPEPLYHMPPFGWFVSHVAAVGLGIARAALDDLVVLAQKRVPTFSTAVLADLPVAQIELARAETSLAAARAFLHDAVEQVWKVVKADGQPELREIALLRAAATNAVEVAASVTRAAAVLGGGSAMYASSSLQRHVRDAEAITHHFSVAPQMWEQAGRVFMGRKPTAPVF
jgi:alkylation response protein AidB-like acyl-CoA dehydrogenase